MKIAIVSDWHLGYGKKTKRQEDAFIQAKEALEKAVKEKPDLILAPGDLFDSAIPCPETLFQAFQLLSIPKNSPNSTIKLYSKGKELFFSGIPVIAIHGTHEFRGKDFKNSLELLNEAGFIFYLHASAIEARKEKEELAVFGLGGVPEKKALDVLQAWNPKPIEGKKNLLFFHQSIKEFLPTDDEMAATISLEHLPKGFDFFVNGHLHWYNELDLGKAKLVMPGSTLTTQMKKLESKKPKCFALLDTQTSETRFIELKTQRKLFYHKLSFENASQPQVEEKLRALIQQDLEKNPSSIEPMIRLKLTGDLNQGLNKSDIDLAPVLSEFNGKAIFSTEKDFFSRKFKEKIKELRELQKSKASIASIGLNLLEKNLEGTPFNESFDSRRLFDLLAQNETEKAMNLLLQRKETKEKEPRKETPRITDYS